MVGRRARSRRRDTGSPSAGGRAVDNFVLRKRSTILRFVSFAYADNRACPRVTVTSAGGYQARPRTSARHANAGAVEILTSES